jgi:hypothetical protein
MRFYLKQQVKKIFIRPNASHEQLQNAANAAYVNEFTDKFEDGFGYFNSRTWSAVIEQKKATHCYCKRYFSKSYNYYFR